MMPKLRCDQRLQMLHALSALNFRPFRGIGLALVMASTFVPAWAAPPSPPALLDTIPVHQPLDLTSLEWIAPRFSTDATERDQWQEVVAWANEASREGTKRIRDDFRQRGVQAEALPEACYGDDLCSLVLSAESAAENFESWIEFRAAAEGAWPYVLSFRRVIEIVSQIHSPGDDVEPSVATAKELLRRFTNDQILRYAFDGIPGQTAPEIDDPVYLLYALALTTDLRRQDGENIEFALGLVSQYGGWPTPPTISEDSHGHLWALVQHGDHRPELQYDALHAMEEKFSGQEQLPQQYGYLYDRVMLQLTGTQRYGTQVTCDQDGKRVPRPLGESGSVDQFRAQVGLSTLGSYLAKFPDCLTVP